MFSLKSIIVFMVLNFIYVYAGITDSCASVNCPINTFCNRGKCLPNCAFGQPGPSCNATSTCSLSNTYCSNTTSFCCPSNPCNKLKCKTGEICWYRLAKCLVPPCYLVPYCLKFSLSNPCNFKKCQSGQLCVTEPANCYFPPCPTTKQVAKCVDYLF